MREKRYIWIPAVILVYFLFMSFHFGTELLAQGQTLRFVLTVVAETAVIIALFFFLRARQRLKQEREQRENNGSGTSTRSSSQPGSLHKKQ